MNYLLLKKKQKELWQPKTSRSILFQCKTLFDGIREASDALEMMVDDELWPLTKYREMLFTR